MHDHLAHAELGGKHITLPAEFVTDAGKADAHSDSIIVLMLHSVLRNRTRRDAAHIGGTIEERDFMSPMGKRAHASSLSSSTAAILLIRA